MSKFELTAENYQNLLNAERELTAVVSEMDTAEKCGIDCQNYRAVLKNQLAAIANIKANYAPKGY